MTDSQKFFVDYSKRLSKCKNAKCKGQIEKGSLRIGKTIPNFMSDDADGEMKQYFHVDCLFDVFKRARATTKVIESADDLSNFQDLNDDDKKLIIKKIKELDAVRGNKSTSAGAKTSDKKTGNDDKKEKEKGAKKAEKSDSESETEEENSDDDADKSLAKSQTSTKSDSDESADHYSFESFQKVCQRVSETSSHLEKTAILKDFLQKNKRSDESVYTFFKLLLTGSENRVYNLNSRQLVKVYSTVFNVDLDDMMEHLNKGDVSETIRHYFKRSNGVKPVEKSVLNLGEVDGYLDELAKLTKENEQSLFLKKITKKFTLFDVRMFVRLIKKDLRIDAGTKVILESISPNAYAAYQASRDLKNVLLRVNKPGLKKDISIKINLMTAIKPMLAEACKSAEDAFKKLKNGILAETKYDGERLQVHKNGSVFNYYTRNLKQVQPHKVAHLKEFIPKAFENAKQLVLDGEVLLYDTIKKCPLPFGTLGVHKKNNFKNATVCYYVFDCLFYNGEDLMSKPLEERRKILEKHMKIIPGRIMISEQKLISKPDQLKSLMMDAIKNGLEGLVIKDTQSIYEPGKRHWLKMKKDYLESGSMADTADLVVLGAYYGTGNKGGMKSIFLMGVFNEKTKKWYTVTKVANGFDDKTLEKLQKQIDMVEIKKKESLVPDWLVVDKSLIPDFVVKNPEKSPVWELTGAEFSQSNKHTADGISIRFPRVTKVRADKSWKEATSLDRLKTLYKISKEKSDVLDEEKMDDESEPEDDQVDKKDKVEKLVTKKKRSDDSDDDDDEEEEKSPIVKKKIKKPDEKNESLSLPSLFDGKTFFIMDAVPKVNELKRYILAYNGEVVDQKTADTATHVVLLNANDEISKLNLSNKVEKITHDKLWECIQKKKKI